MSDAFLLWLAVFVGAVVLTVLCVDATLRGAWPVVLLLAVSASQVGYRWRDGPTPRSPRVNRKLPRTRATDRP